MKTRAQVRVANHLDIWPQGMMPIHYNNDTPITLDKHTELDVFMSCHPRSSHVLNPQLSTHGSLISTSLRSSLSIFMRGESCCTLRRSRRLRVA